MNMRSFLFSKEKYNEIYQTKRIVVASACPGSGVSFVSGLIALSLSKYYDTALAELGKPYFYDALGFEKRFLSSGFVDVFEKIKEGSSLEAGKKNMYKGVNWAVKGSAGDDALSVPEIFRLFYALKEEYCVFDCSSLDFETTKSLLADADFPVIVVDPLPSKLISSRLELERLSLALPKATLIVNKMNNGVHLSELLHFLGTKDFFSINSVPQEYIYKAEYNAIPVSTLPEASQSLAKAQDMLYKLFY